MYGNNNALVRSGTRAWESPRGTTLLGQWDLPTGPLTARITAGPPGTTTAGATENPASGSPFRLRGELQLAVTERSSQPPTPPLWRCRPSLLLPFIAVSLGVTPFMVHKRNRLRSLCEEISRVTPVVFCIILPPLRGPVNRSSLFHFHQSSQDRLAHGGGTGVNAQFA